MLCSSEKVIDKVISILLFTANNKTQMIQSLYTRLFIYALIFIV
ncbi:hypothetical protein GPSY_4620 [Paraglaciecola psychrophila 170]|nr:hypothetical protein GPSY_4620 [Paraglaciecola psychrophila 170]